jgi:hypothetical protein
LNHLLLRLFVLKFQALEGLKSNAKADDSNSSFFKKHTQTAFEIQA